MWGTRNAMTVSLLKSPSKIQAEWLQSIGEREMGKCKILVTELPKKCTECPFCTEPWNEKLNMVDTHSHCSLGSKLAKCQNRFVALEDLSMDKLMNLSGRQPIVQRTEPSKIEFGSIVDDVISGDDSFCGECKFFEHEDIEGYGGCIHQLTCCVYCGDKACKMFVRRKNESK